MTDKPIIFSASMVQALLAGRKNQTRRLLNPQPDLNDAGLWRYPPDSVCNGVDPKLWVKRFGGFCQTDAEGLASFLLHPSNGRRLLPYAPGDRLYVREAWHAARSLDDVAPRDISLDASIEHAATARNYAEIGLKGRLRASIHMPRWASRLTLTVTEVRVQRLQEISEADAVAEGVAEVSAAWQDADEPATYPSFQAYGQDACFSGAGAARLSFMTLWSSLHGPDAWATNPWVVAVSFAVQNGNIDAVKPNA